ncbi:MAG TPA: hypothetical protein VGL38_08535 [bacterium]
MSELKDLRRAAVNHDLPLSVVLRNALEVAYLLDNGQLKDWVQREMSGYIEDMMAVPDYRIVRVANLGLFVDAWGRQAKNLQIGSSYLPDEIKEEFENTIPYHRVAQGVKEIEGLLSMDREASVKVLWPERYLTPFADILYPGMRCMQAWKVLNKAQLEQILYIIRNRLLEFVLELERIYPEKEASKIGEQAADQKKVQRLVQYIIYGDHNVVVTNESGEQSVSIGEKR